MRFINRRLSMFALALCAFGLTIMWYCFARLLPEHLEDRWILMYLVILGMLGISGLTSLIRWLILVFNHSIN